MNISDLIKKTLKEAQDLMAAKTVVGDPIQAGDHTIIPVSKVMFGFGGAGGEGTEKGKDGSGQGIGGGWSIEPVAFVVVGKDGAKLMTISGKESLSGRLMDLAPKVVDTVKEFVEKKKEGDSESKKD